MSRAKVKRRIILGMLVIFAILSVCCSGCGSSVAPIVGALAPDVTLPTLDGGTVKLDELKGQPVLLTFWTTKCGACHSQVPYLQAAFEEKGQEVKFIAINIGESSDTVQQYAENEGVGFTVALDSDATVARAYNIRYIPNNFLIDDQGVIKYIRVGAFTNADELLDMLNDL